jgi:hypothetical protein
MHAKDWHLHIAMIAQIAQVARATDIIRCGLNWKMTSSVWTKREVLDGTRTRNLPLRRRMPYPLGHEDNTTLPTHKTHKITNNNTNNTQHTNKYEYIISRIHYILHTPTYTVHRYKHILTNTQTNTFQALTDINQSPFYINQQTPNINQTQKHKTSIQNVIVSTRVRKSQVLNQQ